MHSEEVANIYFFPPSQKKNTAILKYDSKCISYRKGHKKRRNQYPSLFQNNIYSCHLQLKCKFVFRIKGGRNNHYDQFLKNESASDGVVYIEKVLTVNSNLISQLTYSKWKRKSAAEPGKMVKSNKSLHNNIRTDQLVSKQQKSKTIFIIKPYNHKNWTSLIWYQQQQNCELIRTSAEIKTLSTKETIFNM